MRLRENPKCDTERSHKVLGYFIIGPVVVLSVAVPAYAQRVIYVAESAAGAGDGTSWADAYQDLQDALDDARAAGDLDAEIWIAAGTYKPDRGTGGQRFAFELFGSIAVYGGFAGWEECLDQRDRSVNVAILSGDLNGDDDPVAQPTSDCCVIGNPGTCSDTACHAAVLAEDPRCATRWRSDCNATAVEVCCELCRPTRCDNTYNILRITEPGSVPGVVLDGLNVVDGEGFDPDPQQFQSYAGGLYALGAVQRINQCRFLRNRPQAADFESTLLTLESTSFVDNGMTFPAFPAVLIYRAADGVTIRDLLVSNIGAGMSIWGGAPTMRDCTFAGNWGWGLDCFGADCTIVNCQFLGNSFYGMSSNEQVLIIDSLFLRNSGNAVFTFYGAIVINSVFAGNTGSFAAALECGSAYVLNSVFFGNSANSVGGMWVDGGATIRSSFFWGNSDNTGLTEHAQFSTYSTSFITVLYSVVQGWTGLRGGVGNSGADPMFVDALGPDGIPGTEDDDLRLSPGSPAINAGDPNTAGLPPTDVDGHARVLCGRVDIGAYEFGIGDYNCDQTIDLSDFAYWASCMTGPGTASYAPGCEAFDFNGDDDIDLLDFAEFQKRFDTGQ